MDREHLGICKKKLNSGATIVFLDECGYALIPFMGRTWAQKGTIPFIRHIGGARKKLSVISGVVVSKQLDHLDTKLIFRIHPGQTIASKEVKEFLFQLKAQVDGEIIIIMDNLRAHRSKRVNKFEDRWDRVEIIYLPPYSPDMNPDEGVWNWSKTKDLINSCPNTFNELVKNVRSSLRRLQKKKNILRWCLHESILEF